MKVSSLVVFLSLLLAFCAFSVFGNESDPLDLENDTIVQTARLKVIPRRIAYEIDDDIRNDTTKLASYADKAIENLIHVGTNRMKMEGFGLEAISIQNQFQERYQGFLYKMVTSPTRDIGDHKPLSQFLNIVESTFELTLGIATCKMLHLTDIKTFNFAIPVVFHPCSFPMDLVSGTRMDEYKRHFAGGSHSDSKYDGLISVVTYWVVEFSCSMATLGSGWFFICSPLGSAGEWIMERFLAPKLSDFVYTKACN